MPHPVPLATLVLRAQQLADMEGDPSIGSTEWQAIVAEWYGDGYEIVAGEGNRYFESTVTFTTNSTNILPQPSDQLAIVDQLELVLNAATGQCRRLHPITPQQRARLSGSIGVPRFYELVAGQYYLYPTPPTGQQLTLRYIGQCPDLTNAPPAQIVDCYCMAGRRFVQYGAAIEAIQKSKNDASHLLPKLEEQRKLLWEWAADRAMNAQPVWYVEDVDADDALPSNWSW